MLFLVTFILSISNLRQIATARWRHGSHSGQNCHSLVCPRPAPPRLVGHGNIVGLIFDNMAGDFCLGVDFVMRSLF